MEYVFGESIKWVPGYEGLYAVTVDGKIASYRCRFKPCKPIWLKPLLPSSGYFQVRLYRKGQKSKRIKVHRLVLETFAGPCPPGMQACHYPRGKLCNHIYNLRWDTPHNNKLDDTRKLKLKH